MNVEQPIGPAVLSAGGVVVPDVWCAQLAAALRELARSGVRLTPELTAVAVACGAVARDRSTQSLLVHPKPGVVGVSQIGGTSGAEISVAAAAELASCSTEAIRLKAASGEIPSRKIDGRWYVDRRAVEALRDRKRRRTT